MYRISDTVRSTHTKDGAVVLDIRQGEIFNLNPTGSRILELIKSGSSEAAIVEEISRQFAIDPTIVERDVQEFVASLHERQLLVSTESNGHK